MKIVKLQAENVMKLKAITIKPDGNIVKICGENGAGKSAVLDSIMMALAGGKTIPNKPIREGEDNAKIVVQLDNDIVIERTWDGNKTFLLVKSKDGSQFGSPQKMLNQLIGNLSFDPLEFSRLKDKKQVQMLMDLLKIDFEDLDKQRAGCYSERTEAKRHLNELKAQVSDMPKFDPFLKDTETSINELSELLVIANDNNSRLEIHNEKIKNLKLQIKDLQSILKQFEQETLSDKIDTDEITNKMSMLEETNKKIRINQDRFKKDMQIAQDKKEIEQLTDIINGIDDAKKLTLEKAKFPVKGLSFDVDGVSYRGVPFTQASTGEKIKISTAMGLALNPELKVILVRDASLLDEANLQIIASFASANDAQIWLEMVGDENDGSSCIYIEDGMIRGNNE